MRKLALKEAADNPDRGVIRFDRFMIDLERGSLKSGADEIWLRPKSFAVLRYLAEHAGRLISKAEMFAALWPGSAVTDDSLVQCIVEIRYALRDTAQSFVRTIPRRGYLFDALISRPDLRGSAEAREQAPADEQEVSDTDTPPIKRIDEEFARRLSIAVMPLVNLSGDPQYDYIADALTENLITELSRIRDSKIITPNSLSRYNERLIDAQSGENLWAERYEYDGSDLWGWQDEVTRRITGAFNLSLVDCVEISSSLDRAPATCHFVGDLPHADLLTFLRPNMVHEVCAVSADALRVGPRLPPKILRSR
jgi:DNA-binding winged helix-turn-helix (wHTH) protein